MAIDIATVGGNVLNFAVMIFAIIFIGALVGGFVFLYLRYKKYSQYKCVIWERDGFGQMTERYDMAGIFVDKKTKNKRFFMRKAKVGLDPDTVPYIPSGAKKVVYLLKLGLKNFFFIKPDIKEADISLSVGEEDVNWAINDYERQKKMFDSNTFLQYMPFIALAFTSIIIVVIFIYFFKEFDTLREMAVAMTEAAQSIAQAKAGTVVIPSVP